jgi:hypothetical protein
MVSHYVEGAIRKSLILVELRSLCQREESECPQLVYAITSAVL